MDLEILAGRQFTPTELTINIICRNCADKNETIVNKVNLVTNSLKTGHEAIAAQKESGTSTKRLSSDASGSSSKRSLLLQDAPQKRKSRKRLLAAKLTPFLAYPPCLLMSLKGFDQFCWWPKLKQLTVHLGFGSLVICNLP